MPAKRRRRTTGVLGPEARGELALVAHASVARATNVVERRPLGDGELGLDLAHPVLERVGSQLGLFLQALGFCLAAHPAAELLRGSRPRTRLAETETEKGMVVEARVRLDRRQRVQAYDGDSEGR